MSARTAGRFGAARTRDLAGSALVQLLVLARQRQAIDLAVGTPGFPHTPPAMIDEAVAALRGGHNQYADPSGDPTLRARIAASFASPADPDTEVTVTAGGTEALGVAVLAAVDPGDEVVLLEPFYENFRNAVAVAGGVPRFVPLRGPDWRYDPAELAAAFGPRTRAVVLNSPSNPTGRVLDADELAGIAELCERWDVTVISDEVYANLVFDGRRHLSVADVPGLAGRSIVIGSLSKSHAVSGWRMGYLRANPEYTRVLRRVHEVTTNGTAAPLQVATARAGLLDGAAWQPVPELAARRDLAQDLLTGLGLTVHPAEGGCFLFADIGPVTAEDSASFVERVLVECGVLLVPGFPFFADRARGDRFIRVAFNRPRETLLAAAERLTARFAPAVTRP
ncbi:pyridoxal phosphate-dependent aminotransferase [Micromonospora echinofusca]|uniref:Aminotransferase n=1 Tax=Micromonospora echinofusca TaxID=47858 RepID=A0ABS3VU40_MICEH|nr:pyridoxal phosphate-dependent aminotransferase [Micromonospora echinofusca]MBO4208056.1 aminotransferase class I/II-fold pyridoxal phosphate-dependent enzyme [Micromonospora echinofusca]